MSKIRLDYISKFEEGAVELMVKFRSLTMKMEEEIHDLMPMISGDEDIDNVYRVYQECLSHLGKMQMYGIKLICLLKEKKVSEDAKK